MVKNINGGNHKNQARKHATSDKKLRIKTDEMEVYAYVVAKLGGNKLDVFCIDGKKRLCTIPGKFSNRRKDNNIERGSWLLVGLREWETAKERENCDLLETYSEIEKTKLINTLNEDWSLFSTKADISDDVVHFTNDYEEQQNIIHNEIVNNTRSVMLDEKINIDDI